MYRFLTMNIYGFSPKRESFFEMIDKLMTPGLHGIELSGNPWSCDCRLRALKEWIVTANVPHTIEPTCASPPRLENKQFAELSVEEFACPPDLLSAPRFVEANAGKPSHIPVFLNRCAL